MAAVCQPPTLVPLSKLSGDAYQATPRNTSAESCSTEQARWGRSQTKAGQLLLERCSTFQPGCVFSQTSTYAILEFFPIETSREPHARNALPTPTSVALVRRLSGWNYSARINPGMVPGGMAESRADRRQSREAACHAGDLPGRGDGSLHSIRFQQRTREVAVLSFAERGLEIPFRTEPPGSDARFLGTGLRRFRVADDPRALECGETRLRCSDLREHRVPVGQALDAPVRAARRPQQHRELIPPHVHRAAGLVGPARPDHVRRSELVLLSLGQRPEGRFRQRQSDAGGVRHHEVHRSPARICWQSRICAGATGPIWKTRTSGG